jgi:hypothetical protein
MARKQKATVHSSGAAAPAAEQSALPRREAVASLDTRSRHKKAPKRAFSYALTAVFDGLRTVLIT